MLRKSWASGRLGACGRRHVLTAHDLYLSKCTAHTWPLLEVWSRRMAAVTRRSALEALTKPTLLELARRFELEVPAARSKSEVVDALVKTKRASFAQLLRALLIDDLKKVCKAHELSPTARDKQVLIDRILGTEGTTEDAGSGYRVSARSAASEAKPEDEATPIRGRRRKKASAAAPSADPTWSSGTKLRLQRFALDVAGGYRAGDAQLRFAGELIRCFGWGPEDELPAEIPATVRVVQHGKGFDRRLSAMLRERRSVVEVIDRDRAVREAWNELAEIAKQFGPVSYSKK